MGLLEDKQFDKEQQYIEILTAIKLIAYCTDDDIFTVVSYLLGEEIENHLETYSLSKFKNMHSNDDFFTGAFQNTYQTLNAVFKLQLENSKYEIKGSSLNSFTYPELADHENRYWSKVDFFNCPIIKELEIDEASLDDFCETQTIIWVKKNKDDAQAEKQSQPNTDKLNEEITRLKSELVAAQERINELESTQVSEQQPQNNLLDLILDKTATDRYAPDLVLSIQLWESIYISNPKSDSHKNKSDNWIKKNTPYKNLESVEFKRLREITSPYEAWHIGRKKKFNNR